MERTDEDASGSQRRHEDDESIGSGTRKEVTDVVRDALGDFGWWQGRVCICLSLIRIPIAWHELSIVFLAPPPGNYFCTDGDLTAANDSMSPNRSFHGVDKCHYKKVGLLSDDISMENSTTMVPCRKWAYDHTIFEETIISEWDLVCQRSQWANVAQSSFMFGIMLGSIFFGIMSDKIGRKIPLLAAIAIQTMTGIGTAYIPWFEGFLILRFLIAIATGGMMMTSFVICMEIVGGWWRTAAPILYHVPFGLGLSSLSAFSYHFRHWRHFQLVISLPTILLLSYWWLIPESPRWLLAMDRHKEASEILRKGAMANGREWNNRSIAMTEIKKDKHEKKSSTHTTREDTNSNEGNYSDEGSKMRSHKESKSKQTGGNILDLVKTPNLRCKTLITTYSWLAAGLSFFGMAQYMGRLEGNIFINVVISGATQVLGTIASLPAMLYFGRRNTLVASHLFAGISCVLIAFVLNKLDWLVVALAGIGLVGFGVMFSTNYLYTAELFPTVVRNAGIGVSSMNARIGSMTAPFIATLDTIHPLAPPLTFGMFPLLAGMLVILLPETKNKNLPDTIQEGEDFGKKSSPTNVAAEGRIISDTATHWFLTVPHVAFFGAAIFAVWRAGLTRVNKISEEHRAEHMGEDGGKAKENNTTVDTSAKEKEDIVHDALGDFGWWQARVCICLSLLKLPVAWHQLSIVFLAPPPGNYFCSDGNFNETNDFMSQNRSHSVLDKCHYYSGGLLSENDNEKNITSLVPCKRWVYDHSIFEETIISEWDLVCHRSQLANIAQTSFMFGILLGNFIFGIMSDRFGRKIPLLAAIVLQTITGIGTAYIPWFEGFLVLRFLLAFATGGTMMTSFVICMEIVGGWWRTAAPILYHLPFSIGHSSLSAFSYKFRHWRHFQLAISLPSILLLSYCWLIPESPRWLLAMGHHKKAKKLLTAAAKTNGRTWDAASIPKLDVKYANNEINVSSCDEKKVKSLERNVSKDISKTKSDKENEGKQTGGNVLDLLKTPNLRRKTLVVFYNWLVCGLGFFGIAQYMGRLAGNIFINVAISGAIQIPGTIVCMYAMFHFGRRTTLLSSQMLAGISCLLITCAPNELEWLLVALSAVGLIGMSSAFPTSYLYTAELFPTVVRNAGVGAASMFARIGSLIAPFITTLDMFSPIIPPMIFGIFPLMAGMLALLLPETSNQHLPDTIQEGEDFGKKNKPKSIENGKT